MATVIFGNEVFYPAPVFRTVDPIKSATTISPPRTAYFQRLPTDPIGSCSVTFSGVNAGSEIRVYLPGAVEAAGVENCGADHVLSWSVFSPGSANNTVRIVIIHPDYKIKEFEYVSSVGTQSIPVQQEPDKWYSNPA